MKTFHFAIILLAVAQIAAIAQDLTARELFFAAPAIKQKAASQGKQPVAAVKNAQIPEIAKQQTPTVSEPPRLQEQRVTMPPVIPAAYVSNEPPLGLRYSLMLSRSNDAYREVDSAMSFKSGDRLKVTVESNDEAYLYVIARGSSGLWKVLFPVSEVAGGDNRIQPFRRYEVPNGGRFYFDDQAGEEKLFLVLSRKAVPNFEDLIYTVTDRPSNVKPASTPAPRPTKTIQMAGLIRPIDDALVGKVRSELVARDLVFEKVDDSQAGSQQVKETAVYVVNKQAGPGGKVIVDLKLEHK